MFKVGDSIVFFYTNKSTFESQTRHGIIRDIKEKAYYDEGKPFIYETIYYVKSGRDTFDIHKFSDGTQFIIEKGGYYDNY